MDEQTGQGPHEHAGPDFAPPAGYRPMQGWQPGQDTPGDASPSPQYPGAAQRYPATATPYRPDTVARPQAGIPEGGQRAKLGGCRPQAGIPEGGQRAKLGGCDRARPGVGDRLVRGRP